MNLRILQPNEDKTDPLFASADCQTLLKLYDDYYPVIGFTEPWVAYLIVQGGHAVGSCSFTGKPKEGRVEIAYWTFSGYEGRGIATFACKELIRITQQADPTVVITAKTAPALNASTRILQTNQFVQQGVVQDDEIGDAWLWVFKPASVQ